jgi:hypothetical protein
MYLSSNVFKRRNCLILSLGLTPSTLLAGDFVCWVDDSFGETIPLAGNDFLAVSAGHSFNWN